ncbi:MAG: SCP2 sterol-binding domain-containing protein [Candidatus Hodarchaeota archaeon]
MLNQLKKKLTISNFDNYLKLFVKIVNSEPDIVEELENSNQAIQFITWSKNYGKPPSGKQIFNFWIKVENSMMYYGHGDIESPDVQLTISESTLLKLFRGKLDAPSASVQNKIKVIGSMFYLFTLQNIIDLMMEILESN